MLEETGTFATERRRVHALDQGGEQAHQCVDAAMLRQRRDSRERRFDRFSRISAGRHLGGYRPIRPFTKPGRQIAKPTRHPSRGKHSTRGWRAPTDWEAPPLIP